MIITVTMNPAIDKTVEIEKLEHGGLNRIKCITIDAGGKGINVSKTIKALGGESLATGFLGGNNGKTIQKLLDNEEIATDFITVDAETRINTKIVEVDGLVTELNEPGAIIDMESIERLIEVIKRNLKEHTIVVLSGSVPGNVSPSVYQMITESIRPYGVKVLVDADGELFVRALEGKPNIIKPNQVELEKYMGRAIESRQDYLEAGNILLDKGIEVVIISMGEKGAYFLSRETKLYCHGLDVEVHSTVGAGDAMVAAFSYGMSKEYSFEECAKLAIATSAGAVSTVGTKAPTQKDVNYLFGKVSLEVIK